MVRSARILGAVGNNELGSVGVCWRVQIMACKFLDPLGEGAVSDAVKCIDMPGAKERHINASWGSTTFTSEALRDAIAAARDANIILVAAPAIRRETSDLEPLYPATYKLANVVPRSRPPIVGDNLAAFSNYGATNVHLAAPGELIYSCWNDSDSGYRYHGGTSMSAAFVSGACALTWARHPGENYRQIINRVLAGVDRLPSLSGKCITGGRLNLLKALGRDWRLLPNPRLNPVKLFRFAPSELSKSPIRQKHP